MKDKVHLGGVSSSSLLMGGIPLNYITLGWQPTCHCNADVAPCRVLDPFLGAGTTLAVAARLKRCGVGIDLSEEYLVAAKDRIKKELDTPSWFPRARTRSNPKAVVIQLSFDD